jgi:hypothetical protein
LIPFEDGIPFERALKASRPHGAEYGGAKTSFLGQVLNTKAALSMPMAV